ncbi:MAG: TonB-dependent receptor [Crocinitomicaceae bacterium]|nr:TonB-dependent receptor [Crocinitomicaceae bacterium]MDP5010151.1 TonB-dependent receptor [Crocinitomicaceae bacterium]
MKKYLFTLFLLLTFTSFSQEKFTLSGTVSDSTKGEELINATIKVKGQNIGTQSNEYGFYSITLPAGTYTFIFVTIGYEAKEETVDLTKNTQLNFKLVNSNEKIKEFAEVNVTAKKLDQQLTDPIMGVERLDPTAIAKIPVLLGEKDIIKTMQLLPGVKSAGEGNAGFYVRGGAADQNLILLDEAPVYNASHLLGFFSTFNSDAIKDAVLYKGNQPANFGGRLSSVMDIKMNEGNNKRFNVSGGVGVISSRLNVEGPIIKDKASFLISGRRTYVDMFLKATDQFKENKLYFYDLNAKVNYRINQKNRVFMSGYFGRDKLGLGDAFGINWGNATGTMRWNHIVNDKLFSNTSVIYSSYDYLIGISNEDVNFDIKSSIKDVNIKQEFQYFMNTRNKIRFGINAIHHGIIPGQIDASEGSGINPLKLTTNKSLEAAAFVTNDWTLSEKFTVSYGLRLSTFSLLGNGKNVYSYSDEGDVLDTMVYENNAFVKTYPILEPRVSMSYLYSKSASIKAAYSRNAQYIHLISNTTTTSPTDLWIPSSLNTKPEISDQVSVGWFKNFKENTYELSIETYYKSMLNQIDYRNGANTQANELIEGELLYGIGRAYGVELMLKKKSGRFTGWLGYTLARSERKIEGINNGAWYAAKQDRTHDISIVGIYDITPKLSISALFVYYTGNAVTFPSGKYTVGGTTQFLYTERNGYRMPAYHRMDLGVTWLRKNTEKFESSWNFSIYNLYGRENAFTITFRENADNPNVTEAVQTSLFRWVPSVTYNFKFK